MRANLQMNAACSFTNGRGVIPDELIAFILKIQRTINESKLFKKVLYIYILRSYERTY